MSTKELNICKITFSLKSHFISRLEMLNTQTKRTVHEMALEGDQSAIADLLDTKPELVASKDESGRVPLHWAVSRGHTDLASWLHLEIYIEANHDNSFNLNI